MKRNMDGGEKAFCEGVKQLADDVAPGFGSFIEDCVRKAMIDRGLELRDVWLRLRRLRNMPCNHSMLNGHSCTRWEPSYLKFRHSARYDYLNDCVMVPFAGMLLGIEKDGYTHS